MSDRPFQIAGATVPPMIGRKAIMLRVISALSKPTPDHLQVVGPRLGGKTVFLNALADQLRALGSPYQAVILWDLAHKTPESNEEFMCGVRDHLADAVSRVNKDYGDHLRSASGSPFKEICEVLDVLRADVKTLVLCDGFDKPIGNGKLTRTLWDQLRDLASRPNLRLVTATRRPLHELIRNEDTQTSDFWGIFDPSPVRVGCFDDADIEEAMAKLTGVSYAAGARAELLNWSGGFPPLLCSLLNAIAMDKGLRTVDAAVVNHAGESLRDEVGGMLHALWSDCPESSKDLFRALIETKGLEVGKVSQTELLPLVDKGFAKQSGSRVFDNCRLLEKYLGGVPGETGAIRRLFGSEEAFAANARSLLERRLANLTGLDPLLKKYLSRGIEDIADHPESCLANIRGIVDRALDLTWAAELGKDKKVPPEYISHWQFKGEMGLDQDWSRQLPAGRGQQVRILHLLTGTQKSTAKAKVVTRAVYALVAAAQVFADFGQHLEGTTVDVSMAFAAMNVCLELAACVSRELAHANKPQGGTAVVQGA